MAAADAEADAVEVIDVGVQVCEAVQMIPVVIKVFCANLRHRRGHRRRRLQHAGYAVVTWRQGAVPAAVDPRRRGRGRRVAALGPGIQEPVRGIALPKCSGIPAQVLRMTRGVVSAPGPA